MSNLDNVKIRNCKGCGKQFTYTNKVEGNKYYCSDKCKPPRVPSRGRKPCRGCGRELSPFSENRSPYCGKCGLRYCSGCKKVKGDIEFYWKDGKRWGQCKDCCHEYYKANPIVAAKLRKNIEERRAMREANPPKCKDCGVTLWGRRQKCEPCKEKVALDKVLRFTTKRSEASKEQSAVLSARRNARRAQKEKYRAERDGKIRDNKIGGILVKEDSEMTKWRIAHGESIEENERYYELSDKGQDWLQKAICRNASILYPKDEVLLDIWRGVSRKSGREEER